MLEDSPQAIDAARLEPEREVGVKRGSIDTIGVPALCASAMMHQSGIDVSATLLAHSTIAFALRKSVISWPSKIPPAVRIRRTFPSTTVT